MSRPKAQVRDQQVQMIREMLRDNAQPQQRQIKLIECQNGKPPQNVQDVNQMFCIRYKYKNHSAIANCKVSEQTGKVYADIYYQQYGHEDDGLFLDALLSIPEADLDFIKVFDDHSFVCESTGESVSERFIRTFGIRLQQNTGGRSQAVNHFVETCDQIRHEAPQPQQQEQFVDNFEEMRDLIRKGLITQQQQFQAQPKGWIQQVQQKSIAVYQEPQQPHPYYQQKQSNNPNNSFVENDQVVSRQIVKYKPAQDAVQLPQKKQQQQKQQQCQNKNLGMKQKPQQQMIGKQQQQYKNLGIQQKQRGLSDEIIDISSDEYSEISEECQVVPQMVAKRQNIGRQQGQNSKKQFK